MSESPIRPMFCFHLPSGGCLWDFSLQLQARFQPEAGIITQVKYPHEALLMKQTAQHLAGFIITFAINIIVLLIFHVVPSPWIVLFPLLILPLFFLGVGNRTYRECYFGSGDGY